MSYNCDSLKNRPKYGYKRQQGEFIGIFLFYVW